MLTIFVDTHTSRTEYTFRLVFKDLLDLDFRIMTDKPAFMEATGPKFCYGQQPIDGVLFIQPAGLLNEKDIRLIEPGISQYRKMPVLFPVSGRSAALPFDPFSAAFYMASRYEEYLPFRPDKLGRFEASSGIAQQNGFLRIPVVNHWAEVVRDVLRSHFPEIPAPHRKFRFVPTYDIDIAYAYLYKGSKRTAGAIVKSLLGGRFKEIAERLSVLSGEVKDPYDCYDHLFELQEKYDLCPNYFIHAGSHGKYDKSISSATPAFAALLEKISGVAEIGIHPSWRSADKPWLIRQEMAIVESITGEPVTQARQHFIRLSFPDTYRNYIAAGIIDDYSMGFASDIGFRAGLCSSFFFYDLKEDKETKLRIHPFALMEGTMKDYLGIPAVNAMPEIEKIMKQVAGVGGTFISIFHNESLGTSARWAGWRAVHEQMIEMAISLS